MKIILFLLFNLSLFSCFAQTWQGNWEGVLLDPAYNRSTYSYPFWLNLEQKGDSVWGFSRIEVYRTSYFAYIQLQGKIINDSLFLEETKVINENTRQNKTWNPKKLTLFELDNLAFKGKWGVDDPNFKFNGGQLILHNTKKDIIKNKRKFFQHNEYETYRNLAASSLFIQEKNIVLYHQLNDTLFFSADSILWQEPGLQSLIQISFILNKYPNLILKIYFEDLAEIPKYIWKKRYRKISKYLKKAGRIQNDRIFIADDAYQNIPPHKDLKQRLWFQLGL